MVGTGIKYRFCSSVNSAGEYLPALTFRPSFIGNLTGDLQCIKIWIELSGVGAGTQHDIVIKID
jgi:hypothetical protein